MVVSAAETLKMSINEVEEKFSLGQLILMSTIQNLNYEGNGKTILNRGLNPEQQNKKAWSFL